MSTRTPGGPVGATGQCRIRVRPFRETVSGQEPGLLPAGRGWAVCQIWVPVAHGFWRLICLLFYLCACLQESMCTWVCSELKLQAVWAAWMLETERRSSGREESTLTPNHLSSPSLRGFYSKEFIELMTCSRVLPRHSSAVKSTDCSPRGLWFGSQHSHAGS